MKQAAAVVAMLLLLALVHHADADAGGHHQGHTWKHRDDDGNGGHNHPMAAGLTQCITTCGSGVTACMLDCYQPLNDLDPVELPVCLLKCTNDAMVCATGCAV